MSYLTITRISRNIQNRLAEESEYISSDLIQVILELFLDEVLKSLFKKVSVRLPHFGVFSVRLGSKKKSRDPVTQTEHEIPPRYSGKFRFSADAKKGLQMIPTEETIAIN